MARYPAEAPRWLAEARSVSMVHGVRGAAATAATPGSLDTDAVYGGWVAGRGRASRSAARRSLSAGVAASRRHRTARCRHADVAAGHKPGDRAGRGGITDGHELSEGR